VINYYNNLYKLPEEILIMAIYGFCSVEVTPENRRSLLVEYDGTSVKLYHEAERKRRIFISPEEGILRYHPSFIPDRFFIEHGPSIEHPKGYSSIHRIEDLTELSVAAGIA